MTNNECTGIGVIPCLPARRIGGTRDPGFFPKGQYLYRFPIGSGMT